MKTEHIKQNTTNKTTPTQIILVMIILMILSSASALAAPSIVSTDPANNAINIPVSVSGFSAVFNETMDAATIYLLGSVVMQDQNGADVSLALNYQDATKTLYIYPFVMSLNYNSNYTITITDVVKNLLGTSLANYTWSFRTPVLVTTITPAVASVGPLDSSNNINAYSPNIWATFNSDIMDPETMSALGSILLEDQNGNPIDVFVDYNAGTKNMSINPWGYLNNDTIYTATITTGVKDLAGTPLAQNYSWSFRTALASNLPQPLQPSNTIVMNVSAGPGGSISPSGVYYATKFTAQTFTITPDAGFHSYSLIVNGANQGPRSAYTYSPVIADMIIVANFAVNTPTSDITATAGPGGSISPSGVNTIAFGGNQTFSWTANPGFVMSSVTVDGAVKSVNNLSSSYTFTNIMDPHSIDVAFIPDTFYISASVGTGGTITSGGVSNVAAFASKQYIISPNADSFLDYVLIDGVPTTATPMLYYTPYIYNFVNVAANHTISATFSLRPTAQSVSACMQITSPGSYGGKYILAQDIIATTPGCIVISASNIVLDCQNHTIRGTGAGNGIYVPPVGAGFSNVAIQNCRVENFASGVNLWFAKSISLTNITATNNDYGVYLQISSDNNRLTNINASGNRIDGIHIYNSINNSITDAITNNNLGNGVQIRSTTQGNSFKSITSVGNTNAGIYLYSSPYNSFTDLVLSENNQGMYLYGGSIFNTLNDSIVAGNTQYGFYLYSPIYSATPFANNIYNNLINNTNNVAFQGTILLNFWTTRQTPQPGNKYVLGSNIIGGNYSGGNYWATPLGNGFSETCIPDGLSGICNSTYTIAAGNIDDKALTYLIADLIPPVITMNGISPINISFGSAYVDAGATAIDNIDGAVAVTASSIVNTSIIGIYTVTYTASDAAGNMATPAVRIVEVIDTTAPVITINGPNPVNVTQGSVYNDAGATALDDVDGVVAVVTTGIVDTATIGVYTIAYTATDSANNTAAANRTVNVIAAPPTYISYNITLKQGWNLISLPGQPYNTMSNTTFNYTAESFGAMAGADTVSKWNGLTQTFINHPVTTPVFNFNMNVGEGYFVHVSTPTSFVITGIPIQSLSLLIYSGWNVIGWAGPPITAESFGSNIFGSSTVSGFNPTTQSWINHPMTTPVFNFNINQGEAVFVYGSANTTFNVTY